MKTPFSRIGQALGERRHHVLFFLSVATLLVLGGWWTILLHQNVQEIHQNQLQILALEGRLELLSLQPGETPRLPPDSRFVIEPAQADGPVPPAQFLGPGSPGQVLRPRPEILAQLDERYQRKLLQVFGEGALLLLLLLVVVFMLYQMVLVEGRVRRGMENFLNTVTHELKTPVTGIKALLQTLSARPLTEEELRRYLELGLRESARLQHLVENVLVANRLRGDRTPLERRRVALRPLLERELEEKSQYFDAQGRPILDCDPALEVAADPEALRIIVENLVVNAFKYSPAQPQITVRAAHRDGVVELSVADQGIGLEPRETEQIFEKFYRAAEHDRGATRGSGLGLYIARSLARSIGGEVTATSPGPGRGSTFTLRVPAWN